MSNQERFTRIYKQGAAKGVEILVDTKTGVNYIFYHSGYAGGLAPLLDAEGKPVISKEYIEK